MNFKQPHKAFKKLFLQSSFPTSLHTEKRGSGYHIHALKLNGESGKFAVLSTYALSLAFLGANNGCFQLWDRRPQMGNADLSCTFRALPLDSATLPAQQNEYLC